MALWHLHWYAAKRTTRCHTYLECRCGSRLAVRAGTGYEPIDHRWLETGVWTAAPTRPPACPGGPTAVYPIRGA